MSLTLRQRLGHAFAAFRGGSAPFPSYGNHGGAGGLGGRLIGALPGTKLNVAREVGDPTLNSAVSICLGWIADQFPEPEFQVVRTKRGALQPEPVPQHPLALLLRQPNPYYDPDALWAQTVIDYCVSGDAYWFKRRDNAGRVRELWPLPWWLVTPRWESTGPFIGWYEYRPTGTPLVIDVEDIVHFRFGIDPITRRGRSRLWPVLRNILTDNECETFSAAILLNMGVPAVLISPKDKGGIDDGDIEPFREQWAEKTGGDNRGKPFIPSIPLDVTKLTFSPEELALDKIRQVPEDRICAALRVPAMVAGLSSGAAHKTYANYGEAREQAYEDCIIPLQGRLARCLNHQLLADFGDTEREACRWDYSHVRCLQEDEDKAAKRVWGDWNNGIILRSEARKGRGYEPDEARDAVFCDRVKTKPADAAKDDEEETDAGTDEPDDTDDAGTADAE